jgi:cation transport regulator
LIGPHEPKDPSVPYHTLEELPPAVRRLPLHAQEIFRAAFNAAWHSYADRTPSEREETAFRVAWAAVGKRYRKLGNAWVER